MVLLSLAFYLDLRRDRRDRSVAFLYLAPLILATGGVAGTLIGYAFGGGLLLYDTPANALCTDMGAFLRDFASPGRSITLGYNACGAAAGAVTGAALVALMLVPGWRTLARGMAAQTEARDEGTGLLAVFVMSMYVALYVAPALVLGHYERFVRLAEDKNLDWFYFLKLPLMLGLGLTTAIGGSLFISSHFSRAGEDRRDLA